MLTLGSSKLSNDTEILCYVHNISVENLTKWTLTQIRIMWLRDIWILKGSLHLWRCLPCGDNSSNYTDHKYLNGRILALLHSYKLPCVTWTWLCPLSMWYWFRKFNLLNAIQIYRCIPLCKSTFIFKVVWLCLHKLHKYRWFPAMQKFMLIQVTQQTERFPTYITRIWTLSTMDACMCLKTTPTAKWFITHVTWIWGLSSVGTFM